LIDIVLDAEDLCANVNAKSARPTSHEIVLLRCAESAGPTA
jgi:hypothetical protein